MLLVKVGVVKLVPVPNDEPPVASANQVKVPVPEALKVVVLPEQTVKLALLVVFVGKPGAALTVMLNEVKADAQGEPATSPRAVIVVLLFNTTVV